MAKAIEHVHWPNAPDMWMPYAPAIKVKGGTTVYLAGVTAAIATVGGWGAGVPPPPVTRPCPCGCRTRVWLHGCRADRQIVRRGLAGGGDVQGAGAMGRTDGKVRGSPVGPAARGGWRGLR